MQLDFHTGFSCAPIISLIIITGNVCWLNWGSALYALNNTSCFCAIIKGLKRHLMFKLKIDSTKKLN